MSALGLRRLSLLALAVALRGSLALAQSSPPPGADPPQTAVPPPVEAPRPEPEPPRAAPAVSAPAQRAPSSPTPSSPEPSAAQPALSRAQEHRAWSVSLFGGAAFGTGFSPSINVTVGPSLAAGAEVRVLYRGAVFSGSLGAQVVGVPLPAGPTAASPGVLLAPGVGAGYSFALHPILSLSAVARYSAQVLFAGGTSALHTMTADVPLTVHVGANGLIEPYVQGGVLIGGLSTGGPSGVSTQITGIFSGGARVGLRF